MRPEVKAIDRDTVTLYNKAFRDSIELLAFASKSYSGQGISSKFRGKLQTLLVDMLTASHMQGEKRVKLNAGLQLSSLTDAITALGKRTTLSPEALREKYTAPAFRMASNIEAVIDAKLLKAQEYITEQGLHVTDAKEALQEAFDAAGVSPNNTYTIENIFRTQTSLAYNIGKFQAEQAPEIQEILWGYSYHTVGDDRVRPDHEAVDGTTLPKEDPFWKKWYPPNGWSCRCVVIAEFDKQRSSRGKKLLLTPDEGFEANFGEI